MCCYARHELECRPPCAAATQDRRRQPQHSVYEGDSAHSDDNDENCDDADACDNASHDDEAMMTLAVAMMAMVRDNDCADDDDGASPL